MRAFQNLSSGFTLVEMSVSVLLTAVIVGAALSPVLNTSASWEASQERLDSTQNTRAALEMLARDLRMAGSGVGALTITAAGVPGNKLYVLEPKAVQDGPDTLHLVASLDGVRTFSKTVMGDPSATTLTVEDITVFKTGDLVVISGRGKADLFEVTNVLTQPHRLVFASSSKYNKVQDHNAWPAGGYPVGSRISRVQRVSYWVSEENGVTRLYRRVNSEAPVPIAHGVDDLAIRYILADGTVTESPTNVDLIRSVELDYQGAIPKHAQTTREGYGSTSATNCETYTVRIQPRVLGD